MEKICILGAGSWGTAQAILLSLKAKEIIIWGRPEDGVAQINHTRENGKFLPGAKLPDNVRLTSQMGEALENSGLIVLATPSQSIRAVIKQVAEHMVDYTYIVNSSKGIETETGQRLSQVVEAILGKEIRKYYAVLSGPSHAEEVVREVPTAVTLGAFNKETAFHIQDIYMSPYFRVYTNPDVSGVEMGGALKNIVAIATGIADGLGYGDNTKAALITRGLAEITRMGEAMGGNPRTFSGLSGMGDLVVTCTSKYSRNRRAGILLGKGNTLEDALKAVGMVVEGIPTTKVVYRLAQELNIDMPINTACYNVLYNNWPPAEEVKGLMNRRRKHEIEETVSNITDW